VLISLGVIIAIVALGLDGGRMLEERRRAQAAADAAALAAAGDLYANYPSNQGTDPAGTAKQAALNSAAANGYANDGSASTVTVNIPPTSGPFANQPGHVEVLIQVNLKGTFSAAIQGGDLPLQARAVARGRPQKLGLLLLQSSGADALTIDASAAITVSGAGISVNSTDAAAIRLSGGSLQVGALAVAGGVTKAGATVTGPVLTGAAPSPDPFRKLAAPSSADYPIRSTQATVITSDTPTTLQPGVYRGGIVLAGNASVTLAPGMYILEGGGLFVSGNAKLSGNGVTLYNTSGLIPGGMVYITGYGQVNLTAPSDGTYAGIALFQDRCLSTDIEADSNSRLQVTGLMYTPAAKFEIEGNAAVTVTSAGVISDHLEIADSATLSVDSTGSVLRLPEVLLVE
jgi:hypothetical protein